MLLMQSVGNYSCSGSNCQLMAFTLDVGVCVCVCVCVCGCNKLSLFSICFIINKADWSRRTASLRPVAFNYM